MDEKYYHGTTTSFGLKVGDALLPPEKSGKLSESSRKKNLSKVFVTKDVGSARIYAGRAVRAFGGRPTVFMVSPTGGLTTINETRGTSVYATDGAVIVGKVAKQVQAETEYRYDPKHEHHPGGPGWQKTDKGWTTVPDGQQKEQTQPQVSTPKPEEEKGKTRVKHLEDHELKHRKNLSKEELHKTLGSGYYSVVSAGRNGRDPKEGAMKPDDPFFRERHLALRDDLEKSGAKYTEVVGHYDSEEPSFLVFHDGANLTPKTAGKFMVHHRGARDFSMTRTLDRLGEKYNQDSVLHSRAGRNLLVFTTGKNRGKKCGGKGWKEVPEASNYYTDIPVTGDNHSKVQLDISDCFERNLLAMIRVAVRQMLSGDKAMYRWDPKHHRRPLGPGWRSTPSGWSKVPQGTPSGPKPEEDVKGPIGYG